MSLLHGRTGIAFILGTRPEIIKLSPVIRECIRRTIPYYIIHTGQHHSANMERIFFDDLGLPQPDYRLEPAAETGGHGHRTGHMLARIEPVLQKNRPAMVLVQGDTNSSLAGALAAAKLNIPVGHVEAGLRSFDRTMPEEINRIVIDHVADLLFCPTDGAAANLRCEGLPEERILVTGNTVVDVIRSAENEDAEGVGETHESDYALLTVHRQENVDSPERFENIMAAVRDLPLPVVFPIHPRARRQGNAFGLLKKLPSSIRLIEPVGYHAFLQLQRHARIILTDSGGVQEEACILGVPCITLRENTERPETVAAGTNRLAGWHRDDIIAAVTETLARGRITGAGNLFGDGTAAARIIDAAAAFAELRSV